MGLLKMASHEFSFVPGFGDDVRPAEDYGFPRNVLRVLRSEHPQIEVVYYLEEPGRFQVFAKGDNGKLYFLRVVGPSNSEAWQLVLELDESSHAARHEAERERKRLLSRQFRNAESRNEQEAIRASLDAIDMDKMHWIVRQYHQKYMNNPDPWATVSVPGNYGART